MLNNINGTIEQKIKLLQELKDSEYMKELIKSIDAMVACLKNGGKILLAGNGGSASDAQHFAGEIVGRFMMERKALPAISLCVDPAVVSSIGNDYGFGEVFTRQVSGLGNPGDVFMGISTSGNSENIIKAVKTAHQMGMVTIGLLGKGGGQLKDLCDYSLIVPSDSTPRIQEIHTFSVHLMCEYIEKQIFEESNRQ